MENAYRPGASRPWLGGGVKCDECGIMISQPRWRKHPMPETTITCCACDEKNPIIKSFKRLNKMHYYDDVDACKEIFKKINTMINVIEIEADLHDLTVVKSAVADIQIELKPIIDHINGLDEE